MLYSSPPHAFGIAAPVGIWYNCCMVVLKPGSKFSIRQRSVDHKACNGEYKAVVVFEVFVYESGREEVVLEISQTVPFYAKSPDSLRPDYDRIVTEAATKLKSDFSRVLDVLETMASDDD